METDKIIRHYEIPTSIVEKGNGMASITVDVETNQCDRAFAYIPDLATYSLYTYELVLHPLKKRIMFFIIFFIFSFAQNRMWRFKDNYFSFDPLYGNLNIGGIKFQWDDGIFSITLGKKKADGYKTAYFHAMARYSNLFISISRIKPKSLTRYCSPKIHLKQKLDALKIVSIRTFIQYFRICSFY